MKKLLLTLSLSLIFVGGFSFVHTKSAEAATPAFPTPCVNLGNNMHGFLENPPYPPNPPLDASTDVTTQGEVSLLQNFLTTNGYAPIPIQGGYFGSNTKAAVIRFQTAYAITPAAGYVGEFTRGKIRSLTCDGGSSVVSVSSLSPNSAPIGWPITVTGTNFTQTGNNLRLGPTMINNLSSANGRTLQFNIPLGYCDGSCVYGYHPFTFGSYPVSVTNGNGTSQPPVMLTIQAGAPIPVSPLQIYPPLEPTSGPIGTQVIVRGTGFSPTGNILFFAPGSGLCADNCDGVTFSNLPSTNGVITFIVPSVINRGSGNGTMPTPSGIYTVYVANQSLSLSSNVVNFTVTGGQITTPIINALNPTSGLIGSSVTINGSGLSSASDSITFGRGRISAYVANSDGTSLAFRVPSSVSSCGTITPNCGAPTYQITPGTSYPVSVTTNNVSSNIKDFTVILGETIPLGDPYIHIRGASGSQSSDLSLTINRGSSVTISGSPTGLNVLGNDFSRAFFFDSIFNNACSNNSANEATWTMNCTANNLGTSRFYIEIYKNGHTYRSNIVTVNVLGVTSPFINGISTPVNPNGNVQVYGSGLNNVSRALIDGHSTDICGGGAHCIATSDGTYFVFSLWFPITLGTHSLQLVTDHGTTNSVNFTIQSVQTDPPYYPPTNSKPSTSPSNSSSPSGTKSSKTTSILQSITNLISTNANYMVGNVQSALLDLFDQLQAVNGR